MTWQDVTVNTPIKAIPEFLTNDETSLTMLYIRSGKILYMAPSDDPIFPATQHVVVPGSGGAPDADVWKAPSDEARVLACVDRTSWRNLADGPRWYAKLDNPYGPEHNIPGVGAQWLMYLSLQFSHIFATISDRGGAALNASSLLSTALSLPLQPKQWEVEVRQMFETSLARAQFEASYLAHGTYASYPGWHKPWAGENISQKMCDHVYLANDPNFSNINGTAYLIILIPCLIVIVLSCPCDQMLLWEWVLGEERARRWAKGAIFLLQTLTRVLNAAVPWVWYGLKSVLKALYVALNECLWAIREWSVRHWPVVADQVQKVFKHTGS
jgi:hypothetical protein